ncbi:hypothetical protein BJ165DRAFT_1528452 [Panaeolus papilionaceus]|nr:hypothetical protein BJ165DRAFT_1528452 [Panaeolus papilionaceus]
MFSKVSRRVRRSSAPELSIPMLPEAPKVDVAPALVRWDDFSRPFPPVSSGGYTKYYKTRMTTHDFPSSPPATPYLCQSPEPSTSTSTITSRIKPQPQRPAQSPLFPLSSLSVSQQKRCLSIIRESSAESMNIKRPFFLTITTTTTPAPSPASLRRRKRRLLRTPSIERDFAVQAKRLFGSLASINIDTNGWSPSTETETDNGISPLNRSMSQSSSYDSHDSPPYSLASPSTDSSHHPEFPLTPATSIDEEEDRDRDADAVVFTNPWIRLDDQRAEFRVVDSGSQSPCLVLPAEPVKRPQSRAESFSTAKSSLSEA